MHNYWVITTKFILLFGWFILILMLSSLMGTADMAWCFPWLSDEMAAVFWEIRLPRIICTVLIGAMLSLSGAVFQAVFQNPLVSPDLLGATSGAALGIILSAFLGVQDWWLPLGGLVTGGLITAFCVLISRIIGKGRGLNQLVLILTGILLSSLIVAVINLLHYFMPKESTMLGITTFLMGALNGLNYDDMLLLLVFGGGTSLGMFIMSGKMNLLALPLDVLETQGIRVVFLCLFSLFLASLCVCSTVAVAGIIGWVSLIIPNLSRMWVGGDNRIMLPLSALMGACFMLTADFCSRAFTVVEIPVGILVGIIGCPVFLLIMARNLRH